MGQKDGKLTVFSAMEVARICGVVNQTAINWIKAGVLKAFSTPGKQYRVYPDDLAAFMVRKNMKVPAEILSLCANPPLATKSLLIVDDDRGLNSVLKMYMQKRIAGLQVFQAFDGFEAGALLVEKQPTCLILDLDLPGIDGFGLCKKISQSSVYGNPAIIVVTAIDGGCAESDCLSLGVKKFFKKPLNLLSLVDCVSEYL